MIMIIPQMSSTSKLVIKIRTSIKYQEDDYGTVWSMERELLWSQKFFHLLFGRRRSAESTLTQLAFNWSSPVQIPARNGHYRRPAFAIGKPKLIPLEVSYPVGHPPEIAVYITSLNQDKDLDAKKEAYERAGVKFYLIVDRDQPRGGEESCLKLGMLVNRKYCTFGRLFKGSRAFEPNILADFLQKHFFEPGNPAEI